MQLLLEEFFRKIFKTSERNSPFILKIIVKITFYFIVVFGFLLALYLIITKRYLIISIILGLIIVGEFAHYVRKLRERKAINKISEKNKENKIRERKQVKELIKPKQVKNKSLLKPNKSVNNNLLKINKVKNEKLLDDKKIRAVKLKK